MYIELCYTNEIKLMENHYFIMEKKTVKVHIELKSKNRANNTGRIKKKHPE